jgi:hypothetical protein
MYLFNKNLLNTVLKYNMRKKMTIINTIRDNDKKINRCNYILILLIKKKKTFALLNFI